MRNKKTASAQKAPAPRDNSKARATARKPEGRRAVGTPIKPSTAAKATIKPAASETAAKPVAKVVEKVEAVAAKAKAVVKTAAAAVVEAAPAVEAATVKPSASKAKLASAKPSAPGAPVDATGSMAASADASGTKAPAGKAPAAKAPTGKAPAAKAPAKAEASTSNILLETIRRVGNAAAEAKARVTAPAAAAVAKVVAAVSAPEPDKAPGSASAPAPVPASAPAPAAPPAVASGPTGRPGFPGGDNRLHHLAPRPAPKPTGAKVGFKLEEFIVYPAHGVGQIVAIEEQEVAGFKLELYVISFAKDKMTLKVPTPKVVSVGMRKLAEPALVQKALDVLTGRARIKRTMWSRRAQEYEAKINSGDLIAISEVIRDLYRSEAQPEQSYSERQLYEAALDRMAREIGAVEKLTETETLKLIETQLQKGPRRGAKPEGEADNEGDGDSEPEGEVEEAAA
jgi:CarD family transcriptional regulator